MRTIAVALVMLLLASVLSGCFGGDDATPEESDNVFDTLCPDGIARNVWYHFANGTDAVNSSSVFNGSDALVGDNIPLCTTGSYYGIGMSTFEPTIGITSEDNLYITSWGNGDAGSTAIVQCSSLIGMSGSVEYSLSLIHI